MIIDLLAIATIMVFITDISGVITHIESNIARWLEMKTVHIKLLECSLCQSWWLGLIYLLFTGSLTIVNIAIVALIAYSTTIIKEIYYIISDIITWILSIIQKILSK